MRSHSLNLLTANCLQQRFAIGPLQLPQTSFFNEPQRHRGHREREIAPLNLPNSDRIPSTPQKRSHSLQLPKPPFFNEPQRHRGHRERAIAPLNLPNSDRTPPTPQTAIALPPLPKQRSHSLHFPKQRSHPLNSQTAIALRKYLTSLFISRKAAKKDERFSIADCKYSGFRSYEVQS